VLHAAKRCFGRQRKTNRPNKINMPREVGCASLCTRLNEKHVFFVKNEDTHPISSDFGNACLDILELDY